jgi:anaerobic magnesium-protoporphyrin IX monomethyl ester cyclase
MARVMILYPNRWGRGITAVWIPSHTAVLRSRGHEVKLFDCTFFKDWTLNETAFNTANKQYKPSDYAQRVVFSDEPVVQALQKEIERFDPDVIFWGAVSSHIHGEGEYVATEYGHTLLSRLPGIPRAVRIAGGLQATAAPEVVAHKFPLADLFIRGESELVLADTVELLAEPAKFANIRGLVYREGNTIRVNPPQDMVRMADLPIADYSVFDDQTFLRPYNGETVRAADYELSRGCPYTCTYCAETITQKYYGFTESVANGVLKGAKQYLRAKSAANIFEEIRRLHEDHGVTLLRTQDTNFLSIDRDVLLELADRIERSAWNLRLYIETRPDGINETTVKLLKRLNVDGVGMGIEIAAEGFREAHLNRYSPRQRILNAFRLLRDAGIKRTAYNIIGMPEQDENMVLSTIQFNHELDPDNITVAFYSPLLGTQLQHKGVTIQDFDDYEYNIDAQLRTLSKSTNVDKDMLAFYKNNFVRLAREGLAGLAELKAEFAVGETN